MTKVLGTKLSTLWTRINTVLVPRQATVTTTGSYHIVTLQNAVTPTPDALVSFSIPASSGGSGDSNQNAFSNVKVGSVTIAADTITDTLTVSAGNNINLTADTTNDILTISATDTTYSNATTATSGLMSADDKSKLDAMSGGSVWYGTSSTTASTAEKAVTCDGFDYKTGSIIAVLFTTANTADTPTLNVNSKGAKSVLIGNASANATNNVLKWSANTILLFMYNGFNFRYLTAIASGTTIPPRGANTWYGTCSVSASTAAKTSTIDNFVLIKGSFVILQTSTANTVSNTAITLNVNSTGAVTVYYGNAATSSTNTLPWNENDVLTFMYDGTYWRYVSGSTGISPSITETDPIFSGSAAAGITAGDITNWNGKTDNIGTVTAVKINNTTKTASSGIVDLGTVLTTNAVQSVNTKTGAVTLTAADVGALPSSTTYVGSLNSKTGTITITGGNNVTVSSSSNTITISSVNTTYAPFIGATTNTAGSAGLVPSPAVGETTKLLWGDGYWKSPKLYIETGGANGGLDLKFLKVNDSGTSQASSIEIPTFVGATDANEWGQGAVTGVAGLVPSPPANGAQYLLYGDGEFHGTWISGWNDISGNKYTGALAYSPDGTTTAYMGSFDIPHASTITPGLMSAADKAKLDNYDVSMTVTGNRTEIRGHLRLYRPTDTSGHVTLETINNSSGDFYITLYDQDDIPSYKYYFSSYGNIARQAYDGVGGWEDADYYIPRSQLAGRFSCTSINISPGSVAANSTKFSSGSVARTGYTPVGISGYYLNGAAGLTVYCIRLDGTDVQYGLRNPNSSASSSTATLAVQVMYVKDS